MIVERYDRILKTRPSLADLVNEFLNVNDQITYHIKSKYLNDTKQRIGRRLDFIVAVEPNLILSTSSTHESRLNSGRSHMWRT